MSPAGDTELPSWLSENEKFAALISEARKRVTVLRTSCFLVLDPSLFVLIECTYISMKGQKLMQVLFCGFLLSKSRLNINICCVSVA